MVTYLHIEQSFRALGPPFSATGIFLQAIGGCQKRLPKDRLRTDGCAERLSCCALRREKAFDLGTALPNFLLWSKIFQLPPFLRIFEILERTKKGKGGSTKRGGSWGVRFLGKGGPDLSQ